MWIVTNKGFMSVVAKDRHGKPSGKADDAEVSVRFRRKADAKKLFPDHERVDTPGGDYECRVFATRFEVGCAVAKMVIGIDYTNFKDSIPKKDTDLYSACTAAWSVYGRLQPGGPYGAGLRTAGGQSGAGQTDLFERTTRGAVHDPFCDGCGMRVGTSQKDALTGLCESCAEDAGEDWEPA